MADDPARASRSIAAAALSGFAGLGLESLAVSCSGLALGYGGSAAIGLSTWLAAWALGAGWSTRRAPRTSRPLRIAGLTSAVLAPLTVLVLLALGASGAPPLLAGAASVLAIAAPAAAQGVFLPWLARGARSIAWLFAANLVGSLLGAWLVSDVAVGAFGRVPAAALAGLAALAAGILAPAPRASDAADHATTSAPRDEPRGWSRGTVALWIGAGVAWASALQWILLRVGVLWFGGMQNALNAVLCASLSALAVGACAYGVLARARTSTRAAVLAPIALVAACVLATSWPFFVAPVLSEYADAPLFVRAAWLCVPALAPFGAWVPLVHARVDARRDAGERLGGLLFHEAWGAAFGIPLVHLFVVPRYGLSGAIAVSSALGVLLALSTLRVAPRASLAGAVCAAGFVVFASVRPSPVLDAPALASPAFRSVSVTEDRDFAVAVVDDGMLGERTLLTDGFRAAGTGRDYRYMEALGHLPILLHPAPRRVAVLALGTGTTLGAVSLHPEVERIDVLEISRAVVAAAPAFLEKNHGALAEGLPGLLDADDGVARVVVRLGDGRATLSRSRGAYDVVTMEPLLPDSPFAVYLYTREFYARASAALAPGGLVCQWVPPHALEPATFDAVLDAFASSFAWTGVWIYGTQVLLVGGEREPTLDRARFAESGGGARASSRAAAEACVDLGIASTDDVVARWCGPVPRAPATTRELRDADPWIVHRPRRSGIALLTDLPVNLSRLARVPPPSDAWRAACSDRVDARLACAGALRRARTLHAWNEVALRGGPVPADVDVAELPVALQAARGLREDDPELRRFGEELEFLDALRRGVTLLAASPGRDAAAEALDPLLRAAELRGERADVHLDCAVALERLGSPAASKALSRALAACPRLAETPEGARARRLGLSDASWGILLGSAGR